MVWAATTFKYTFDYRPGDVYFCTADIGWITGVSLSYRLLLTIQDTATLLMVRCSTAPRGFLIVLWFVETL